MISFVIPAHDEEALIGRTLQALHVAANAVGLNAQPGAGGDRRYEIIVVDDASTDRTADIARRHGARVVSIDRRQIAAARNAGARAAAHEPAPHPGGRADVLIFVDADTVVPEAALRSALQALDRGAAGGGSSVRFDGAVPRWASVTLAVLLVIFRLLRLSGGCFLFCTRRAFDAAGGWDETLFASEELTMAAALKRHGRFIVIREAVITSGRKLRAYSLLEFLAMMARVSLRGRGAVRQREGLEIWYGRRRADPQCPTHDGHA